MVSRDEVEKVAENARLSVEEEELEGFVEDFENILEMFETLETINSKSV